MFPRQKVTSSEEENILAISKLRQRQGSCLVLGRVQGTGLSCAEVSWGCFPCRPAFPFFGPPIAAVDPRKRYVRDWCPEQLPLAGTSRYWTADPSSRRHRSPGCFRAGPQFVSSGPDGNELPLIFQWKFLFQAGSAGRQFYHNSIFQKSILPSVSSVVPVFFFFFLNIIYNDRLAREERLHPIQPQQNPLP